MNRLLAILVLVLPSLAHAQTTVTLRSTGAVPAGTALTVGQVADVDGKDADAIRAAVIAPAADVKPVADGWMNIDLDRVRAALAATPGVSMGSLTLRGSFCSVRVESTQVKTAAPEVKPAAVVVSADAVSSGTVAQRAAVRLAAAYGVAASDLRVRLPAEGTKDGTFLARPVGKGERVEVQVLSASARVPMRIDIYAKDRVVESRTVSVEVSIRREVFTAAARIERDQPINEEQLTAEARWMSPSDSPPSPREKIVGSVAKRRIEPGRPFTDADVQAAVVVSRGEEVWVHCLSGQVVVKVRARAQAAARDGELVELKRDGAKKTFTARMSGRGVAVLELGSSAESSAPTPPLKEAIGGKTP